MCVRDLMKGLTGDPACSQRKPWDERDSRTLTIIHNIVPFTVREAVAVLHGNDGNYFAGPCDVFQRYVGQSDGANLTLFSQLGEGLHGEIKGHDRIRNMQLVHVDTLQSQSLQAT